MDSVTVCAPALESPSKSMAAKATPIAHRFSQAIALDRKRYSATLQV